MPQPVMPHDTDLAGIAAALQRYLGDAGAVGELVPMEDGHAGLTFGFAIDQPDGSRGTYILKKGPRGVPRRGSTDVCRQAPLLRTLHDGGFRAPGVRWACTDDTILGAPFIVMDRLPGRSFVVWEPSPSVVAQFADPVDAWLQTASLMADLHRVEWRERLADWEDPIDLPGEIARWRHLLRHMQSEPSRAAAMQLADALAASRPGRPAIGLTHGDLQPGNVLFDGATATGLIDWDLAALGPVGSDVGWLAMMGDPRAWASDWPPVATPGPDQLLDAYREAGGVVPPEIAWYCAFAQFRMAAIAGLNLKLHRDGRRPDPLWERFDPSVPVLLGRAFEQLESV